MTRHRFYVVYCHPLDDSFTAAVRDRVIVALDGEEVRCSDLYADGFRPELSLAEWREHLTSEADKAPATRSEIATYVDGLRWCDTLILVYPTWWSGQPAMLKGWFDRVWVRGVAWERRDRGDRIRPLLGNIRRIVVVTSHGSSKWLNALEGEGGKRTVSRALRATCHPLTRTQWIAMYTIDRASRQQSQEFLARVERKVARLRGR